MTAPWPSSSTQPAFPYRPGTAKRVQLPHNTALLEDDGPELVWGDDADPNGNVTGKAGDFFIDVVTPTWWIKSAGIQGAETAVGWIQLIEE